MPALSDARDRRIWTESFRHGYAGFIIRPGSDPTYTAGYRADGDLRSVHRQDFERALFQGRPGDVEPTAP